MKTACFGHRSEQAAFIFLNNLYHIPLFQKKYDIIKLNVTNNGGKYGFSQDYKAMAGKTNYICV